MSEKFIALVIEDVDGKPRASFRDLGMDDLPDYPVLVEIAYSSLNYKDGLAITGKGRIAKRLPMVGGIDLAGTVRESSSLDWKPGDRVMVNGWGLSETEWGGYARYQRLKPEWLTPVPKDLSLEDAMAIGTAGYTAALCVNALEAWGSIHPGEKDVLVTGAAGGVGSTAVSLLASKGYRVVASTGRSKQHDYQRSLGASAFLDRSELSTPGKPLQQEKWGGAIDSVGSTTLVNVLAQTAYGGAVTACGLAGGAELGGFVFPHILRSVALIGVDSVYAPAARREQAWETLSRHLDREKLALMTRVEPLHRMPQIANEIIEGKTRGRIVVDIRTSE
jgi:putative YhdH/YhfP family quinone oxidoreductase